MNEDNIRQVTEFLHEGILLTQQAKTDHEAAVQAAASPDGPPTKPTTKVTYLASLNNAILSPSPHLPVGVQGIPGQRFCYCWEDSRTEGESGAVFKTVSHARI